MNGLFYGDGKGCSKTCTKEPTCQDSNGKTQACTATCGDGNLDPGEECDDGNLVNRDGCSATCKKDDGFTCSTQSSPDYMARTYALAIGGAVVMALTLTPAVTTWVLPPDTEEKESQLRVCCSLVDASAPGPPTLGRCGRRSSV